MPGGDEIDLGSIERFIKLAVQSGTIDSSTALRLWGLACAASAPPPPAPAPPRAPSLAPQQVAAAEATLDAAAAFLDRSGGRLQVGLRQALEREVISLRRALQAADGESATRSEGRLAAALAAAGRSLEVAPAAAASARPVVVVTPPGPPPPSPPVAPRRPAGPTWSERLQGYLGRLRRAVGSDFAIHGITYLGVFLALVVLVVFFAVDDYFGRTFRIPWTRPFMFLAFPAFFFVLAWVLRHRSGIPQAAVAVELIGAVLVPAMVAALFRDGFWFPPNVERLGRWAVYAGSGLPAVLLFWWLARRRPFYAYLIAPTIWTVVGALGLYVHFEWIDMPGDVPDMPEGISAYQVVLILAVMAASVVVASVIRRTRLGRLASVPTVRMAAVLAPFVLLAAVQFAYSDAVLEGPPGVGPGLAQMGFPLALAAAAAGAVFLAVRWAAFAWEGLPARMRREIPAVAAVLGGAALAAAPPLGLAEVLPLPWVGAALCGTGVVLAALERLPGFGTRAGSWVAAAAASAGLAVSLGGGGATLAAWGVVAVALAAFPAGTRRFFRAGAVPAAASRALLEVAVLVALGAGAARLAWPEGTVWVLVGAAAVLAGLRRAPHLPGDMGGLPGVPAAILVAAGLGVAAARAAGGTGPGYAASGALILAAGLVVLLLDAPWLVRLLPGVGLLAAGGLVELRPALDAGEWTGAAADAAVLGGLGLALVGDALLRRSGRFRIWHAGLGHLLAVAAAARSLPHERSALVGLAVLFAAQAAEAAGVEHGRSVLVARLTARSGVSAAWEALPAAAAAMALPFIMVLAGRRIPGVAAESARSGLVLATTALGLAGGSLLWRKRARPRVVTAAAATAVALAGVGCAAPSATGLLLATGAATLSTAIVAIGCRLPWAVSLPWTGAAGTLLLGLWRAGVAPLDLRFGVLGCGAALAAAPALVNWRRGRPRPTLGPWLWPPLMLGLGLLGAAVGLGLAETRLLAVIALPTAGVMAFAGWSSRLGAVSLPVTAAVAVAYAHLLGSPWPVFSAGVRWMPLAAVLMLVAAALPGRRGWRPAADPSPGTLVAGLVVAGMGVGVGAHQGDAAPALLCLSGVLTIVWATRRAEGWLWAALVSALVAGLVAAPEWWWLAATAGADALVVGALAVRRAESDTGRLLSWLAAGLAAVAFGALTEWGQWATVPLLAAAAAAAGVSLVGATTLGVRRSWRPGLVIWQLPAVALAAGAGLTLAVAGHARLGPGALGVDAAVMAGGALATGLVGTLRLWPALAGGSAALAAGAYGCLAGWQHWDADLVVIITSASGAALAGAGAWLSTRRVGPRRALWHWPLHGLAQAAAVAVVSIALHEFATSEALGTLFAVLAAEAVLFGLIGTARRHGGLVALSALTAAGAYGCLAGSLGWEAATVVGVTGAVGAVLAGAGTWLSYWRSAPARVALWRLPLHGAAQVAAVAVAGVALQEFSPPGGLGVVAAVLAAEAFLSGAVGTVERWPYLVSLSALFTAGAYGCLAGWLDWSTDLVVGVTAGLAVLLASVASLLSRREGADSRADLWRLPLHGLTEASVVAVGVAGVAGYAPAGALGVVAAAVAFEAVYVAVNVRWLPAEASPRHLSAGLAAIAIFLGLAAVGQTDMPTGPWVQGAAALGLVAAIGYGLARADNAWREPLAVFAGLVAPGAAIAATWMAGAPYAHTAAAMAFGGAGLVAIGLLKRRLAFLEGGLVVWLGAGLIAFRREVDFTSHSTVVPVAVALLLVLEVERRRRRLEGREPAGPARRLLEWGLMLAPLVVSVADATVQLWYLGVLAAEGAVLMAWGILTAVRRRALLGVGALGATILLAAIIPLSRGIQGGLSDTTWLAVGAGAAVLLIAIGSTLERQRRRIGRALAAASRAMEGWE